MPSKWNAFVNGRILKYIRTGLIGSVLVAGLLLAARAPMAAEPYAYNPEIDTEMGLSLLVSALALVALVVMVIWNRRLRGEILQRQETKVALRESEQRFHAILQSAPIGVSIVGTDGTFNFVNSRMLEIAGVSEEVMLKSKARDFYVNPEERDRIAERLRREGFLRDVEVQIHSQGGPPFWILLSFEPTGFGDGETFYGWVYDIDKLKQTEAALNLAKEEAEAAAEAKSEFIATVSHEVRTPMNGVLGMARLILETPLNDEQLDYARTIVDSGEALLTILNDLLDISKLEAGKLEIEELAFSPFRLIEDTIKVMRSRALEKGLKTHFIHDSDMPRAVIGDANRLRQIILNLLSNAIKFTDRGEVSLEVRTRVIDDGWVELSVSVADTGPGITDDAAKKLFMPYTQTNVEVARKYGGTGLGLSISSRLAELMGGEIVLKSKFGEGSTFILRTPFRVTDAKLTNDMRRTFSQTGNTQHNLRILLVEDNLINRKVAIGMIGKLGHITVVAENGREALDRMATEGPFDVILMDRHMPVMDDIVATKHIRAMQGDESHIPIVGLTAAVTELEIQACLEAGMNNVVTKPIEPVELQEALVRAYEGKHGKTAKEISLQINEEEVLILDQNVLDMLCENFGADAVGEFTDDFRTIGKESAKCFQAALEKGDLELMAHYSHDLKNSAAIVGLKRLSQLCQNIEVASKEDCLDDARNMGERLEDTLKEGMRTLDELSKKG